MRKADYIVHEMSLNIVPGTICLLNFKISLIIPGDIPLMTLHESAAGVCIFLRGRIGPQKF